MKHILRKLHIGGGHDSLDGRAGHDGGATTPSSSSSVPSFSELGTPEPRVSSTGLSGWWRHTGGRSRFENNTGNAGNVSSLRPVDDSAATSIAPAAQEEEEGGGGPMDFNFYEEEFQVQMALALSASNNDVHNDPESLQIRAAKRISLGRPPSPGNTVDELFSYRYWAYNVLDYSEKVVDGFYDVYGVAADFEASEKMPSLVDLQGTPASGDLGYEVVLVNRTIDPDLVQLEQTALCLAVDCESSDINQRQTMLVQKIADLVAGHMGGPVIDANLMLRRWQKKSYGLRSSLNNIVLPLGCLQIGLSRHRALLFKVLADHVGIACRLVKGSHYTGTDEGAVNIIKFDDEREYILDLMGAPGTLLPPESGGGFYAGEENMDFRLGTLTQADVNAGASNKRQGKSGSVEEDYAAKVGRMISKNWEHVLHSETEMEDPLESFGGSQPRVFSPDLASDIIDSSCTFVKDNTQSTEESRTANVGHSAETMLNAPTLNRNGFVTGEAKADASTSNWNVAQELSLKKVPVSPRGTDLQLASTAVHLSNMRDGSNPIGRNQKRNGSEATSHSGNTESYLSHGPSENACKRKDHDKEQTDDRSVLTHQNETVHSKRDNVFEDVAEWEIPWEEITIGGRIGLGSYGEVYHGDWHDREVAVKKFLDQDLSGDALDEFRREVRIMRRMSHPNVVLFMGAVTRPPNLSIVTEYLPRGSLFRLIHRPSPVLDEKRRLRMALDVAKGMNYLHTSTPIIVHRDLKSPNLLVDKNWVVKVCDFGLSRMKHHTFLSSKSTAGTPEWMAPEVLRNEPSNEKCDVYSFGVILWELVTLQQPWSGMNPMQVVGAVGFQSRHLTIPENVDPLVSKVIQECWRSEPGLRPSFSQLILALEPLQRLTVLEMDTRR